MKRKTMIIAIIGGASIFNALIGSAADTMQRRVNAENACYAQTAASSHLH